MENTKLIKYGHEYCGPCKALKPILEEIKTDFSGRLQVIDKDTYSISPEEIFSANIKAVPTLILLKNDVEVWRHVGFLSKDVLSKSITDNM